LSHREHHTSFRWARDVDGITILVEFLCETDEVEAGRIGGPGALLSGHRIRSIGNGPPLSITGAGRFSHSAFSRGSVGT
jgi:hypothetical protein